MCAHSFVYLPSKIPVPNGVVKLNQCCQLFCIRAEELCSTSVCRRQMYVVKNEFYTLYSLTENRLSKKSANLTNKSRSGSIISGRNTTIASG